MTDLAPEIFAQYAELRRRVDEKFAEVAAAHAGAMKCASGCHKCCAPGLTVSALEAAVLRDFLRARPELAAAALVNERANPHRGKRCSFLSAGGECLIYEARPLVCRSHGIPLQYADPEGGNESKLRDVCDLNFVGVDLAELNPGHILNLETVNLLLSLLNQRAFGKKTERVALQPSALVE